MKIIFKIKKKFNFSMALHSIKPMHFSDISKNTFLFLVAQRRVNLPDSKWVIKSSKSVPKKKKLSLNFLLAKFSGKFHI